MDAPEKRCSHCKQFKSINEFQKNRSTPDGLQNVCKSCTSMYGKRHYANNKEAVTQTHADWRLKNSEVIKERQRNKYHENLEHESERKKQDRIARPEVYKARGANYRAKNRDKIKAWAKEYYAKKPKPVYKVRNPLTFEQRCWQQVKLEKRRAEKAGVPNTLTYWQWLLILQYWDDSCAICGSIHRIEIDHWVSLIHPDSPGNVIGNIIPLCKSCNSSKNNRVARGWLVMKYPSLANTLLDRIELFFRLIRMEE